LSEPIDSPEALRALPDSELPQVCQELREEIIALCGKVGGHLGASLGAVELIVALHRVFHSPKDALIFDVGHQAYAHKLLTGRRARMHTLRQAQGVAPFLDPRESPHDVVAAGHACTAISEALGILQARRQRGHTGRVVAVVGDGALTGGLSFEGLNNAGASGLPLVVVLNDNQMSISANVGAVARMLPTREARHFFEALGLTYLGPLDGHSLPELEHAFKEAKRSPAPIVIHVRTQKGRGFPFAEEDANTRGHAMGPYELRAGKLVRTRGRPTFSERFSEVLVDAMAADPRVCAVTPAMLEGSSLAVLKERFPERVFDVGIAEGHAVTFAAGLAAAGMRPVCCIYSTFLQRALDSVIHDVCLPSLPVTFAVDRAGLVGADGATHQGAYDLAMLRPLPHLRIAAPVTGEDLAPALAHALASDGPSVLRFPRATLPEQTLPAAPKEGGRWLKRVDSAEVTLIGCGPLSLEALEAARSEPRWAVWDAFNLKPLDATALEQAAASRWVVTVEEAAAVGGLGSAVLEGLSSLGKSPRTYRLGLPEQPIPHGDARIQRVELGLSAEGIRKTVRNLLESGQ